MAVSRLGLFGVASRWARSGLEGAGLRLGPVWPRGRWPSPGSGLASWALAFAWSGLGPWALALPARGGGVGGRARDRRASPPRRAGRGRGGGGLGGAGA